MARKGTSGEKEIELKPIDDQLSGTENTDMDIDEDLETNSLPESEGTYNLEDDITPPIITPREPSDCGSTGEDTSSETSEDIIPYFLFHMPSSSRTLNMEFNRCLLLDIDSIQPTFQDENSNKDTIMTPRSNNPEDDDDDSSRYDNHKPAADFVPLMLGPFDYGRIIPSYFFATDEDDISEISQSDLDLDSQETERELENLSTYRSIMSCDYATEEENFQLSRIIEDDWLQDDLRCSADPDEEELLWLEEQFWESEDENDSILYTEKQSPVSSESTDISSDSSTCPEE